jgi:predicted flavoprotein YhiN
MTAAERKSLRMLLKDFRFNITGHRAFNHAIVTSGGVSLREISPTTMESKLVKGLFFAGEILDVDADTGGFNLQAAFSTGWLAGRSL